jgi:hypothetical protein
MSWKEIAATGFAVAEENGGGSDCYPKYSFSQPILRRNTHKCKGDPLFWAGTVKEMGLAAATDNRRSWRKANRLLPFASLAGTAPLWRW